MDYRKGDKNTRDIVDEIVSISGLYNKVFGELLDGLVFDRGIDSAIEILQNVYGFENIKHVFDRSIDRSEFSKLSKIIFRFYDQPKTGLFSNNEQK